MSRSAVLPWQPGNARTIRFAQRTASSLGYGSWMIPMREPRRAKEVEAGAGTQLLVGDDSLQ